MRWGCYNASAQAALMYLHGLFNASRRFTLIRPRPSSPIYPIYHKSWLLPPLIYLRYNKLQKKRKFKLPPTKSQKYLWRFTLFVNITTLEAFLVTCYFLPLILYHFFTSFFNSLAVDILIAQNWFTIGNFYIFNFYHSASENIMTYSAYDYFKILMHVLSSAYYIYLSYREFMS